MPQIDFSRIRSNIAALNSLNSLNMVNNRMAIAQTRLATGKRINSAADDPAGLRIAVKFDARNEGLKVALGNISDAQNLLSTAESGLSKISDLLIQIRSKAEEAVSDSVGSTGRTSIGNEIQDFLNEINDIVARNKFNGTNLIDGSASLIFQTGSDSSETTSLTMSQNHTASALSLTLTTPTGNSAVLSSTTSFVTGYGAGSVASGNSELGAGKYTVEVVDDGTNKKFRVLDASGSAVSISGSSAGTGSLTSDFITAVTGGSYDTGRGLTITFSSTAAAGTADALYAPRSGGLVSSSALATAYMSTVDTAITTVSGSLATIGGLAARLNFKTEDLSNAQINTEASYNRIMNADMAAEQVNATKYTILQQTSIAMLAQANAAPQGILSLFR
ncbi:MAG: flagellin [Anaerolineae bacterium]